MLYAPLPFLIVSYWNIVLYMHLFIFSHFLSLASWRMNTYMLSFTCWPTLPHFCPGCGAYTLLQHWGVEGRSGCNWKGLWLAVCTRPLPCQLIGTMSGQIAAAFPLIDGYQCQESTLQTRGLYSQFTASGSICNFCIYAFILICS